MCEIDVKTAIDALNLYQTQYTQVDKLWGYFGTVTLAIVGFAIGSEKATKSFKEATVLVVGYLIFCFGNFQALSLGQRQLVEFSTVAREIAAKAGILINNLIPLSVDSISIFYRSVVIVVCIGILVITWIKKTSPNE